MRDDGGGGRRRGAARGGSQAGRDGGCGAGARTRLDAGHEAREAGTRHGRNSDAGVGDVAGEARADSVGLGVSQTKHVIGRRRRRGHDTGGDDDNTAGGRAQDERCGPSRVARDVTERAAREYRHDSDKQVIPVAASHDGEAATNHRQRPRQQARKLRAGRQHRAPGATTEAVARSMGGRRRVTGSATGGGEELTHRTRRQPIKGRQHGSPAESGVNKKPDNRHSP